MRIVDVSRVIQGRMPLVRFQTHPRTSFTRVEAPAFIFRTGRTIGQILVESFVSSAVLLDVSSKEMGEIDDEDLEGAEEAAGLSVREGELVLLHTSWEERSTKRKTPFPGLSRNAIEYLLIKRIAGVAVDCPSIDAAGSMHSHKALLRNEMLVIEDVCNLGEIDRSRFRLLVLPFRLKAAVSPVRVVALLDEF